MVAPYNRRRKWKGKHNPLAKATPNKPTALLLSLLLTGLLLFTEFFFSYQTNSLLLFCSGLIQFSLGAFILHSLYAQYHQKTTSRIQLRLATALLNGFFLLLFSGYIFLESYARTTLPTDIVTRQALVVLLFGFIGNIILQRLLPATNHLNWKFGGFRIPVRGLNAYFLLSLFIVAFIHLTKMDFLDTLMGLLIGVTISIWAAFTMMDAYWKIREVNYP